MSAAMSEVTENVGEIDAAEGLRADFYDFLSGVLADAPSPELMARATALEGDDSEIGRAAAALAKVASGLSVEAVAREYHTLFIGLGRGELVPYASVYMTGFLNEKPLARLRGDMARLGMARSEGVFEPEDNIASLCEMMAGLIRGRFGPPAPLSTQRDFFAAHLAPWATHFFTDLEAAKSAVFYAPVGALGRAFMEIEREAFRREGG